MSRRNKTKHKRKKRAAAARPLGHVTLPPPVAPLPPPDAEPTPVELTPRPQPRVSPPPPLERTPLPRPMPAPLVAEEPVAAPRIPRATPWIGAAAGLFLLLPLACVSLLLAMTVRLVAPASLGRIVVIALVFAGLPALLSGWGVARLAAHRALEVPVYRVLRTAVGHATSAALFAGAALTILVAVPLGGVDELPSSWALVAGLGALCGLPGGIALGWWAARRPLY